MSRRLELLQFPSDEIRSLSEFQQHRAERRDQLDTFYRHELSLASKDSHVLLDGTCGACLKTTTFCSATEGGQPLPDGRRVPHWREQLLCSCEARLNNRQRALLHLLEAKLGAGRHTSVLTVGPHEAVSRLLSTTFEDAQQCPRPLAGQKGRALRLPAVDEAHDIILSVDYIDRVPAMEELFAEIVRSLRPGGFFVFTVPFFIDSAATISRVEKLRKKRQLPPEADERVHDVGWDVLTLLCAQGFEDAWADLYWSREFGYLGTTNAVFVAMKRRDA